MDKVYDKPRLPFIVLAQIVGCLLVIFGHSYPFVTDVPTFLKDIRTFVYCFHMPLFVWCSGFLFVYTKQADKRTFGQFAKVRAKRLLIPYLFFSLVGILPKILFSEYLNENMIFEPLSMIRVILVPRENIWGHFWFLPMIFFIGIIGFGLEKSKQKFKLDKYGVWVGLISFFALSFVGFGFGEWFGLNDVIKHFFIYVLGMTCADMYDKFEKIKKNALVVTGIVAFAVSVLIFVLLNFGIWIAVDFRSKVIAILMIISLICLCKVFENVKIYKNSLIAQTYTIFILSWPCQLITEIVLERIWGLKYYIVMPSMFIVGMGVPILIIWFIDKIEKKHDKKIISFILGR